MSKVKGIRREKQTEQVEEQEQKQEDEEEQEREERLLQHQAIRRSESLTRNTTEAYMMRMAGLVIQLVGSLSPVNHIGLYQG